MKTIHLIIISLCLLIGCKSIEKDNSGLVKTQREEAQGKYDGKKDIIEYKRNGNLILRIVKHHKKNSDHVCQIVQTIYYNENKVLMIRDMDFSDSSEFGSDKTRKQLTDERNCTFLGFDNPDIEVNLSLDKKTGLGKYISIHNPKTYFFYDTFEFKNGLIIPSSDFELKKTNKIFSAVTDMFSDLPEAIKTQKFDEKKFMKKLNKHTEEIENIK